jgi:membrane fusion protein, multidrug efflux system
MSIQKIKILLQDKKYANPIISGLLLIVLILMYRGCSSESGRASKAVPIQVAQANLRNMSVYIAALGTVTPQYTAIVKTQIDGQLVKVNFQDGQNVKKNDLLAEVDSKIYEVQVERYREQWLRDKALLKNANLDLIQYKTLRKKKSISKQALDSQIALVKQYEGAVQLDQGLLDAALENLNNCKIVAPFDGRLGLREVDEGNLVQTTDPKGIVAINMIDPILVVFSIPERKFSQITSQASGLEVNAYNNDQHKLLASGRLKAINNQIDMATGTIKLKAEFENKYGKLFPNQFVNVKLKVKEFKGALVVPTTAIQYGTDNNFVYLVEDNKVKATIVKTGVIEDNDTMILSGIEQGQIVAVSGVDRLSDGALVFIPQEDNGMFDRMLSKKK